MSEPASKLKETEKVPLSKLQRKARKLKRDPRQFFLDSKAYVGTRKAAYLAWAKLGSFALVLFASLLVVGYYAVVASPRYATVTLFVVKEAGNNEAALMGIAALGSTSTAMRDALIIKEYIESREMAVSLDNEIGLKAHYQDDKWDTLSSLRDSATVEDYVEFYKQHISVRHDEMSDIVHIEVQAFTPEYSLLLGQTLLEKSESFINSLGDKMAKEQLAYAQKEVERLYANMKNQQRLLVLFQNNNELYNPEQQGSAMLAAIGNLQAQIIGAQAKLKEMIAVMRDDAAEVKSQRILIKSLQQQLTEEQGKLTSDDQKSLNQITANFQEIKLNTELATGLYQAGLSSMEVVRADAYRKLKHLLIVQQPAQPETDQYPRRIYSIMTWFVSLLLVYLLGRLMWAIVKEHKE
ncbi:lipopolysaccharide biosynthesis protein [Bermanella sp. WJH001]|uniref:lipopolysaccharide biosynthesis protein n=1 Tax=Bermanella sp. WJH001 TaxID=3048005 RepID=UPI0024BDA956|nr:lipopolysaccharide biosynthesis protein [Bermanella sp. WJH001]MDJ1539602.1 lipopolysaccharide biosynthesis protein [Bermanella sp. WJH001]